MVWIIIFIVLVVLIISALVFATSYFFRSAFIRKEALDLTDYNSVKGTHLEPYLDYFKERSEWFMRIEWETVSIVSDDGLKLYARYLACCEPKGTIILVHGYHSSGFNDFCSEIEFLYGLGYCLLLIDQRSHGKSEGRYISFGVHERYDCKLWAEYIRDRFGKDRPVFLNGISMGCSTVLMASNLGLPGNVKGIIADCGFTSPYEIVKTVMVRDLKFPEKFPLLYTIDWACRFFAGYRLREYSTLDALENNNIPILFIHGDRDAFVPIEMTYRNYEACKAEKDIFVVNNAAHAMSFAVSGEACKNKMKKFIEKYSL